MLIVLSSPSFSINVYGTKVTQINLNRFYLVFPQLVLPNKNEIYFRETFAILIKTFSFNQQISLDIVLSLYIESNSIL